jgi:hypothetical protein
VANKQPDKCPGAAVSQSLRNLDINSDPVKETIRTLVAKNVAITSTLPVFEAGAPLTQTGIGAASALMNQRMLNVMNTDARVRYLTARSRVAADSPAATLVRKSMEFERAFVRPEVCLRTDHRNGHSRLWRRWGIAVESGFPTQIASFNGAQFLGEGARASRAKSD